MNTLMTAKYVGDRTQVRELRADVSNELIIITHQHSKVHEGKFFSSGHYVASVAAGAMLDLLLLTPATKTMHTHVYCSAGADATFDMYEDVVVSAVGTSVSVINNNRSSSNAAEALVSHTPTVTALGTKLDGTEYLPGGSGVTSPGLLSAVGTEQLVLAANKQYLLRLTNVASSAQPLCLRVGFYEV